MGTQAPETQQPRDRGVHPLGPPPCWGDDRGNDQGRRTDVGRCDGSVLLPEHRHKLSAADARADQPRACGARGAGTAELDLPLRQPPRSGPDRPHLHSGFGPRAPSRMWPPGGGASRACLPQRAWPPGGREPGMGEGTPREGCSRTRKAPFPPGPGARRTDYNCRCSSWKRKCRGPQGGAALHVQGSRWVHPCCRGQARGRGAGEVREPRGRTVQACGPRQ